MCGTARSEFIARTGQCSNDWDRAGAETLKGRVRLRPAACRGTRRAGARADRNSEARGESPKRVGGGRAKSRPRLSRRALEGRNPREQPAVGALNTCSPPGTPGRAKTQEPRSAEPASPLARYTGGRNGRWVLSDGNVRIPFWRRKLRRVNPRSAAGAKQNRQGIERSKPSRG